MSDHQRILALDFGDVRIGVAISDPFGWTAQSLPFVPNTAQMWTTFEGLIQQYTIHTILLGLPKNREGGDSAKAEHVRAFGTEFESRFNLPLVYRDERFSTTAVTKHLLAMDVSRAKRKTQVDSQAAAFILQGYLDSLKS